MRDWRSTPPASQVLASSKSHDTKTRTDIKNPVWTNLDIILQLKNQQSLASSHWKWRTRQFENGRISNFQRHVTLTLTLDRATWHTVVHHSLTSLPTHQMSFKSEKLSVDGRTYVRMYVRQTSRPALLGQLLPTRRSRPKKFLSYMFATDSMGISVFVFIQMFPKATQNF